MHNRFAFNSNDLQVEHIAKKIQNAKKKIKQSARDPQINQQRSPSISRIFRYQKGTHLTRFQNKNGIKHMKKTRWYILYSTPLVTQQFRLVGPKVQTRPTLILLGLI